MSLRIFISHTESDSEWVERQLIPALADAGLECNHKALFSLGKPLLVEFEESIKQSDHILLICSPAYCADESLRIVELLAARHGEETRSWPVIPIIRHSVDLPPRLAILNALDATDEASWPEALDRLCRDLKVETPPKPARPRCPYPGMKPFERESPFPFYGRREEVAEIIERLRLHPLLTVIGASGSGKSSLVHAGLIPGLSRSQLLGEGQWLTSSFRPSEGDHNQSLFSRFEAHLGGRLGDPESARTCIDSLLRVAPEASQPNARRLLLVIDQFEEVYTLQNERDEKYRLTKDDAVRFQQAVMYLSDVPKCYVVLTVRADFFGELMESPIWDKGVKDHRFELTTLGAEGMRQAIVQPALDEGVCIDAVLAERLLAEAGSEPGILPFLQETLVLLWDKLHWRYLSALDYESMVKGRRAEFKSGLEVAMAQRADAAIRSLPDDEHRLVARRILLRLVHFGVGRLHTRRQQTVEQLSSAHSDRAIFDMTLTHLTDKRLLTIGDRRASHGTSDDNDGTEGENSHKNDQRSVDIAHDKLITGWPALSDDQKGWIVVRRQAEETRRDLERKVQRWIDLRSKHLRGGLLDKFELAECDKWVESKEAAEIGEVPELDQLQRVSRTWVRLQQGLIAAIPLLVIVAMGFWIWGVYGIAAKETERANTFEQLTEVERLRTDEAVKAAAEQKRLRIAAQRAQDVAESRRLGVLADSVLPQQLDLAMLLAIEATRTADTLEGRCALQRCYDARSQVERFLFPSEGSPTLVRFGRECRPIIAFRSDNGGGVAVYNSRGDRESDRTLLFEEPIWDMAIGPQGQIAIERRGTVVVFDRHGDELYSLTTPSRQIWDLAFGPASQLAVAHANPGGVALFDSNGKILQLESPQVPGYAATCVAFGSDGRFATGYETEVRTGGVVIHGANGNLIGEVAFSLATGPPFGSATSVSFAPDGRLAVGSKTYDNQSGGAVAFFDKNAERTTVAEFDHPVESVAFRSDGYLAAALRMNRLEDRPDRGRVVLFDAREQVQSEFLEVPEGPVEQLAFASDDRLATLYDGMNRGVILWNLEQGRTEFESVTVPEGMITDLVWDSQGHITAITFGKADSQAIVLDTNDGLLRSRSQLIRYRDNMGYGLRAFDNGQFSVALDDHVILLDAEGGRRSEVKRRVPGNARSLARSSYGDLAVSYGSYKPGIVLYDTNGEQLWDRPLDEPVNDLEFSVDGRILAALDVSASVTPGHPRVLLFSVEGTQLPDAVINIEKEKERFGAAEKEKIWNLTLRCLAFSRSGRLAVGGKWSKGGGNESRGSVHLIEPTLQPYVADTLAIPEGPVESICFSKDGCLAVGFESRDGTGGIVLFDHDGKRLRPEPFLVKRGYVNALAFGNSGLLAAAYRKRDRSESGLVLLHASVDSWRQNIAEVAGRNVTWSEWTRYFPGNQPSDRYQTYRRSIRDNSWPADIPRLELEKATAHENAILDSE